MFHFMKVLLLGGIVLFALSVGLGFRTSPMADAFEVDRPQRVDRYLRSYHYLAAELKQRTGIPMAVTFAVAGLESNWGVSELAVRSNNHFGIKSKNWDGPIYCKQTQEYASNGYTAYYPRECFRKYRLIRYSYLDFGNYMDQAKYRHLYDYPEWNFSRWAFGLQEGGYATDPKYAAKLISIIDKYKLYLFDEK